MSDASRAKMRFEPGTFSLAPDAVLRRKDISPAAKLVYVLLLRHQGKHATAWPAQATLAEETGLTERTVRSAIKALEAAGLIETLSKGSARRKRANVYRVIWPIPSEGAALASSGQVSKPDAKDCADKVVELASATPTAATEVREPAPAPGDALVPTYLRRLPVIPAGIDFEKVARLQDAGREAWQRHDFAGAERWNEQIEGLLRAQLSGPRKPDYERALAAIAAQNPHLKKSSPELMEVLTS